jgi:hypothetical protein
MLLGKKGKGKREENNKKELLVGLLDFSLNLKQEDCLVLNFLSLPLFIFYSPYSVFFGRRSRKPMYGYLHNHHHGPKADFTGQVGQIEEDLQVKLTSLKRLRSYD